MKENKIEGRASRDPMDLYVLSKDQEVCKLIPVFGVVLHVISDAGENRSIDTFHLTIVFLVLGGGRLILYAHDATNVLKNLPLK